jgi:hypothetical protein
MLTKSCRLLVQYALILIGAITFLMLLPSAVNADPNFAPLLQADCTIPNPIPAGDSAAFIDAINCANSTSTADIINLTNSEYQFPNAISTSLGDSALPAIASAATGGSLTINGNGATIRRTGTAAYRLISVNNGATLTLNNLTLSRGNTDTNGGAIVNGGTLTTNGVRFTANRAAVSGGALFTAFATVNINNSTFDGNSTTRGAGGALAVGITFGNTVTVTNSAFTANSSPTDGGAIWNSNVLIINNSTLSGNSASRGGNLFNGRTNSASVSNTILTNAGSGGDCFNNGGTINMRHSLVADGLGCVTGTNINNLTGNPQLNGDLTLQSTSIAVDAGDNALIPSGVTTDLAGNARIQGLRVDMGAFESAFTGTVPNVTISATDNTGAEAGSDPITFRIERSPASVFALNVIYTVGGTATNGLDYTPTLTGTAQIAANQTFVDITLMPVDDAIVEGDETVILTLVPGAGYELGASISATATIIDNDTAGITINPTSGLVTTEAGGADTFTIVLTSQPSADVTIGLSSSDPTEGTVSPTNVTFTPAEWNVAQTVTVTGVDDFSVDGSIAYTIITAPAVSDDPNYNGLNASDVSVTNVDDDTAGITVNPTSGLVTTEAGGADTFTIVLTSQPSADVTIGLSSSDPTEGTVSPTSVTFTPADWNVAQTVTVTGLDDSIVDGSIAYTIITAPAVSDDPNYDGIDPADVSVTNVDDDTAGITINPTSGLTTTEAGGADTFIVMLNSQPSADVTIDLSSSDPTEGMVSPASVMFTPANWNEPQTVTVTGLDDSIVDGDIAYTIITAPAVSDDPNYDGIDPADVSVTNVDNDTAGITINPTSGLITTEAGGADTFTIVLTSQPSADVTIGLSSSDPTEGTVSPTSVMFTPADWNVAQTVTVTGVDDTVDDGDVTYTIITAPAVSDDELYNGLNASDVSVTNMDDDAAGIIIAPLEFYMQERTPAQTYSITLVTTPSQPFTLAISFDPVQVRVEGSSTSPVFLTFTNGGTVSIAVEVVENDAFDTDRVTLIEHAITTSGAPEYPLELGLATVTINIAELPPPPPTPTCEAHNFDEGGVVRSSAPDATSYAINCRILYQNGASTSWLGSPLYSEANLGVAGLLELGVQQAVDIFSPPGLTYFNDGAVFCLRGTGTLIWLAASGVPRVPHIIGSYTVPEFPGFTCATLFEPGTLILVSRNPLQ